MVLSVFQDDCKTLTDDCVHTVTGTPSYVIPAGDLRIISFQDDAFKDKEGQRFDAYLTIQYNDSRTLDNIYQSSGRLWGSIEPPS